MDPRRGEGICETDAGVPVHRCFGGTSSAIPSTPGRLQPLDSDPCALNRWWVGARAAVGLLIPIIPPLVESSARRGDLRALPEPIISAKPNHSADNPVQDALQEDEAPEHGTKLQFGTVYIKIETARKKR